MVVSRDQDSADLLIASAVEFSSQFRRHHIHSTFGQPEGYPKIHLVRRYSSKGELDAFFADRNNTAAWRSGVTYKAQPSGTAFLYISNTPNIGGDTAFVDQAEAYRRLFPATKEQLHGLQAVHSEFKEAESSRQRGGTMSWEPAKNEHPYVRTHPVTWEKALFLNRGCNFHSFNHLDLVVEKLADRDVQSLGASLA